MNIQFNVIIYSTILATIMWLIGNVAFAQSVNYCHDETVNKDWERLVHNTTEPEVKELYRLRKELCRKVDAGLMELETAIDIFEEERSQKIEAIKHRKMRLDGPGSASG